MKARSFFITSFTAVLLAAVPDGIRAETAEDFYRGKTVIIVVGGGMGGSTGFYATLLSRHMRKYIPGNPTIVPQPQPGAGGVISANYVYNVAKRDGTELLLSRALYVQEKLKPEAVKYRSGEFTWIGGMMTLGNLVLGVRSNLGVSSIADLQKREVTLSTNAKGSLTAIAPELVNGILKTKLKIVHGYKASNEAMLAVMRQEVDGTFMSYRSWKEQDKGIFQEGGPYRPLLQLGHVPLQDLPGVPMFEDLLPENDLKNREILAFFKPSVTIVFNMAAPPHTPTERVAILRDAFDKAVKDQQFRKEASVRRDEEVPVSGRDLEKLLYSALSISPEALEKFQKLTK